MLNIFKVNVTKTSSLEQVHFYSFFVQQIIFIQIKLTI